MTEQLLKKESVPWGWLVISLSLAEATLLVTSLATINVQRVKLAMCAGRHEKSSCELSERVV
jgi:hypothetical protein